MCQERIRLSDVVAKAVQTLHTAKAAHDLAAKEKRDTELYGVLLADARAAERAAVSALDQHRKEHDC